MPTNYSESNTSKTRQPKHIEWMKNLPENLRNEPISKIAIPGTHDSFAFHLTDQPGPDLDSNLRRFRFIINSFIRSWSVTQNKTFIEQLSMGIRYFDLRVCRTTDSSSQSRSPFMFTHGLLGPSVRDSLEEINEFLNKHRKEIVLLDFNHFYNLDEPADYRQLIQLIRVVFGKKLCTTAQTIHDCTLNYLWNNQQQVILLYQKEAKSFAAYVEQIEHLFKVCESPWPHTPRIDELFRFLDREISVPRPTTCVNVVQGQTTPDNSSILKNLRRSLEDIAGETNTILIQWVAHRQRDPSVPNGVNVVICDFVDQAFADAECNQHKITQPLYSSKAIYRLFPTKNMESFPSSTQTPFDSSESRQRSNKRSSARRRRSIEIIQNVRLIWLDEDIDDNSVDYQNTIRQLRRIINTIDTYTDFSQCVEFVKTIINEKACVITSGSLGQHIVPHLHDMSQVDSIFIFCVNKPQHESWIEPWPKIKGVFTDIGAICEALRKAAQECEHNAIPISFMATSDDLSKKKLDQLDCSFMYTQIIKEILLSITFEQKHIEEFIEYSREQLKHNREQLTVVTELEKKYRQEPPIWWYTRDCFLYPMLNSALRLMNADVIIQMGFFINDLHRDIQQQHSQQFHGHPSNNAFTVYRGQGMSSKDFQLMKESIGGLIAFNNFLSTSKKRDISLNFSKKVLSKPDITGIFFVMTVDPSVSTIPFASVNDVGYFEGAEDEVLFSMHAVFRLNDIKSLEDTDRLYQVELTLTSDDDRDLHVLADRIKEEAQGSTGWFQLGEVLIKMGQYKKALQIYEILLDQTIGNEEEALAYHNIGLAKYYQGEFKEALIPYEKALEIRQQILPPNHPDIAKSYNYIGNAYTSMCEYSKALSSHQKALEIRQQVQPPNHLDLVKSYGNIGIAYKKMDDYPKAISSFEKALETAQQYLPPNHPDLAYSYNNIGNAYHELKEYSKAYSAHQKALEIRQQILPPNHPELAMSYNNRGNVYAGTGEYSKALSSYEKALEIWQQSLSPNHPHMAYSYGNIGEVYASAGEYSKALSSYEKALAVQQQSLPPNHPHLADSYGSIGEVYENIGNYAEARSYYERAVDVGQLSLPANHSGLQKWKTDLDRMKNKA